MQLRRIGLHTEITEGLRIADLPKVRALRELRVKFRVLRLLDISPGLSSFQNSL
jgi:hypothetical protein